MNPPGTYGSFNALVVKDAKRQQRTSKTKVLRNDGTLIESVKRVPKQPRPSIVYIPQGYEYIPRAGESVRKAAVRPGLVDRCADLSTCLPSAHPPARPPVCSRAHVPACPVAHVRDHRAAQSLGRPPGRPCARPAARPPARLPACRERDSPIQRLRAGVTGATTSQSPLRS